MHLIISKIKTVASSLPPTRAIVDILSETLAELALPSMGEIATILSDLLTELDVHKKQAAWAMSQVVNWHNVTGMNPVRSHDSLCPLRCSFSIPNSNYDGMMDPKCHD